MALVGFFSVWDLKEAGEDEKSKGQLKLKHRNFRRHSAGSFSLTLFVESFMRLSNTIIRC